MESKRISFSETSNNWEKMADKLAIQAEKAKGNKKIKLLKKAIDAYQEALKNSSKDNKLPLQLSILSCYDQLFDACEPEAKKTYAEKLIGQINETELRDSVTDRYDLYDVHFVLFKAYRELGEQEKALHEAEEITGRYARLKKDLAKTVKNDAKRIKNFDENYFDRYEKDYEQALNFIKSCQKKSGSKNLSLTSNAPYVINNFGGTINLYGSANITINNITINSETPVTQGEREPKKRKLSKNSSNRSEKKSEVANKAQSEEERRIEIVNGIFYVNGKKVSKKPEEVVEDEDGIYYVNDVELVDHGKETPVNDIAKRALLNQATNLPEAVEKQEASQKKSSNKPRKRKKEVEHPDQIAIELFSPSEPVKISIKTSREKRKSKHQLYKENPGVIYKAPLPRLIELSTQEVPPPRIIEVDLQKPSLAKQEELYKESEENTLDKDAIDSISQAQWGLFQQNKLTSPVIKKDQISTANSPSLKPTKYKTKDHTTLENVRTIFEEAYQAYANEDYKQALKLFRNTLLHCRKLAKSDNKNKQIHEENALLAAHYIEYITASLLQKIRTPEVKNKKDRENSLKVDPVTTLLQEEFQYIDPCVFPTTGPKNQPTDREFKYSMKLFAEKPTSPKDCSNFKKAQSELSALQKSTEQKSAKNAKAKKEGKQTDTKDNESINQLEQIVNTHQFRGSSKDTESTDDLNNINPLDLHASINANTMVYVLTDEQNKRLVKNVINIAYPETISSKTEQTLEEEVEKNAKQEKPRLPKKRKMSEEEEKQASIAEKKETDAPVKKSRSTNSMNQTVEQRKNQKKGKSPVKESEGRTSKLLENKDYTFSSTGFSLLNRKDGRRNIKLRTFYAASTQQKTTFK